MVSGGISIVLIEDACITEPFFKGLPGFFMGE